MLFWKPLKAFEMALPEVKPRSEITFSLLVRSCLQSHTDIGNLLGTVSSEYLFNFYFSGTRRVAFVINGWFGWISRRWKHCKFHRNKKLWHQARFRPRPDLIGYKIALSDWSPSDRSNGRKPKKDVAFHQLNKSTLLDCNSTIRSNSKLISETNY